jgi:uroporphyrinogen-III decarboxylase
MAEMTPRERLLAAIRFQGPDRVPVNPRFWRYMLKHDGSQSHATYLKYVDEVGLDPILLRWWASPIFPHARHAWTPREGVTITATRREEAGCTIVSRVIETPEGRLTDRTRVPPPGGEYGIAPDPHTEEFAVKGRDDLPALRALVAACRPLRESTPDFRAFAAEVGTRGLTGLMVHSAMSNNAGDAMRPEDLMVASLDDPDLLNEVLDIFHQPLLDSIGWALEDGAEVISVSAYYESMSGGWSPALYRQFFLPRLKQIVDLAHARGAIYFHYDDGKMRATLQMLRELGADLVSTLCPPPTGDVTLAEARGIAGKSTALNGGIDTVNTLWRGTPESVDRAVREAIEAAALPEGGYLLGTSDSITEEAPPENFAAFFSAARKYGRLS